MAFDDIEKCAANKSNGEHICEDLLDSLAAYYKVSRKRFVDVLGQQVVSHLLLNSEGSALQIFGPEMVMQEETYLSDCTVARTLSSKVVDAGIF